MAEVGVAGNGSTMALLLPFEVLHIMYISVSLITEEAVVAIVRVRGIEDISYADLVATEADKVLQIV